jgi:SNF2 family DNA or RNA helicase
MISSFRSILGAIHITQKGKVIRISGLSARGFTRGIASLWKTNRIVKHMFTRVGGSYVEFPLFFAPDVLYMVETMIDQRPRGVNVRALAKVRKLLLADTWLSDTLLDPTPILDLKQIDQLHLRPKDYQLDFLKTYDQKTQQYHLGGYLLAGSAGSGKTVTSMWLGAYLNVDTVLVISPKNAVERVWESEILSKHKQKKSYWIYAQGKPWNDPHYVVLHYEALTQAEWLLSKLKDRKRVLVILDECHNLNDIKSLRTQRYLDLVTKLRQTTERLDVLPMSGTPLKAMGAELIPLLTSFDPYFDLQAQDRFKRIYGSDGNRALDILNHRMGNVSYKVAKTQLGLAEPDYRQLKITIPKGERYTLKAIAEDMRTFIDERAAYYKTRKDDDHAFYRQCLEYVEERLTGSKLKELATYKQYVKRVIAARGDSRQVGDEVVWCNHFEKTVIIPLLPKEWQAPFREVKSIVKYLNLKIQGEALGRILGRKRTECHVEMCRAIDYEAICSETTKKTVVFTSFVPVLEEVEQLLTKSEELNPLKVYGKTNNELARIIQSFDDQEDLNPLIATYQSLSTAVPLVMADTMIMIDAPFRAYIREQAIARINRLGADTQATIWECSLDTGAEPNISTRSADILEWSQQQVNAIMGTDTEFNASIEDHTAVVSLESHDIEVVNGSFETSPSVRTDNLPNYVVW